MKSDQNFRIGNTVVDRELLVFASQHTVVFVNPSPFLPGHVVAAPINCRRRLCDLARNECVDLFLVVRTVVSLLGQDCNAFTIYMQEGTCDEETEHLHIHVVPRKKGDIPRNDDIYKPGALRVASAEFTVSSLREYADELRKKHVRGSTQ